MSSKNDNARSTGKTEKVKGPNRLSLKGVFKRALGRPSKKNRQASNVTNNAATPVLRPSTEIPIDIWMAFIFPLLDRSSQNILAEAHPEVAQARRAGYNKNITAPNSPSSSIIRTTMNWPSGRITKKFSRPVKCVLFFSNNGDTTLWVTYCKPKIVQLDKLGGPTRSNVTTTTAVLNPNYLHSGIVADLQFSPCGNILATASKNDGTIKLWRLDAANNMFDCFRILQVHQRNLRYMLWSPKGNKIVSWGEDGFIRVSNVQDGAMVSKFWKTRLEVAGCQRSVAFDPTGTSIAFSHNNDEVYFWDLASGVTSQRLLEVQDDYGSYAGAYVTSLTFSPDGQYLLVGCHVALIQVWRVVLHHDFPAEGIENEDPEDGILQRLQPQRHEYVFEKDIHAGSSWSAVTLITFAPDSRFLACSNNGSQIRIIDFLMNKILKTFTGHTGRIESLCFTSDGNTLASGSCDRTVRLWDTSKLCRNPDEATTIASW